MCYLLDPAGHAQIEQFLAECLTTIQQSPRRAAALGAFFDKRGDTR